MAGQRKRKRRQEAERQRIAARTAPDVGRWAVVFETGDESELHAELGRLREERVDESMIRIDTLCGRLTHPTAYRLSRFVPTSGTRD